MWYQVQFIGAVTRLPCEIVEIVLRCHDRVIFAGANNAFVPPLSENPIALHFYENQAKISPSDLSLGRSEIDIDWPECTPAHVSAFIRDRGSQAGHLRLFGILGRVDHTAEAWAMVEAVAQGLGVTFLPPKISDRRLNSDVEARRQVHGTLFQC